MRPTTWRVWVRLTPCSSVTILLGKASQMDSGPSNSIITKFHTFIVVSSIMTTISPSDLLKPWQPPTLRRRHASASLPFHPSLRCWSSWVARSCDCAHFPVQMDHSTLSMVKESTEVVSVLKTQDGALSRLSCAASPKWPTALAVRMYRRLLWISFFHRTPWTSHFATFWPCDSRMVDGWPVSKPSWSFAALSQ